MQLIISIYEVLNAKRRHYARVPSLTGRDVLLMNSFVRLPKKVRQALDCGWPKNYRTQLQIPNFEPAPKGLFLITGLELDL